MKPNVLIALDVGGTFIKSCIVENGVPLAASFRQVPALADRDADTIINQFIAIFRTHYESYVTYSEGKDFDCRWHIGIAFPGPFDYEQGICYIQGLSKFESLYGMNLKTAFNERLKLEAGEWAEALQEADIRFEGDARLFALGVSMVFPEARFISLTLGTGLGSAFIDHSTILELGTGVPENGWLFNRPFRDGTIDDAFSRRGILQIAEELGALAPGMDVLELADAARLGKALFQKVFTEFGTRLAEMLTPYVASYKPDFIVLGGQISKSYDLFGPALESRIGSLQVITTENMPYRTFIDIWRMFE